MAKTLNPVKYNRKTRSYNALIMIDKKNHRLSHVVYRGVMSGPYKRITHLWYCHICNKIYSSDGKNYKITKGIRVI